MKKKIDFFMIDVLSPPHVHLEITNMELSQRSTTFNCSFLCLSKAVVLFLDLNDRLGF